MIDKTHKGIKQKHTDDSGDLAGNGQLGEIRFGSLLQQPFVVAVQRFVGHHGDDARRRILEDRLAQRVVVAVETAGLVDLGAFPLAV